MLKNKIHHSQGIVAYQSYCKEMHKDDYFHQEETEHLFEFLATSNKYKMYFDQATNAPYSAKFSNNCVKEFSDHIERENWRLITREEVL